MYDSSDDDEPRVYVDNHNTPTATVTIPISTSTDRREWTHRKGDSRSSINSLRVGFPRTRAACHSADSGKSASVKSGVTPKPTLSRGRSLLKSDVHPHLEDVYQRVMRRLQRNANYDDIASAPLAVQFGIVDDSAETAAPGSMEPSLSLSEPALVPHANSQTQPLNDFPSVSSIATTCPGSRISNVPVGGVLKRKARASFRRHGSSSAIADGSAADDTLFLSKQPCPMTLRLVLEHVMKAVGEKLYIANGGSLKDCLRLVFESRTLLDRLLKEIPTYSQFQGEGDRLPNATQIQQMYQEFRQTPMILPTAQYAMDPTSGRVLACVNESPCDGRNVVVQLPRELRDSQDLSALGPILAHQPQPGATLALSSSISAPVAPSPAPQVANVAPPPTRLGLVDVPNTVALPNGASVAIPATYGRSTRRLQAAGGASGARQHSASSRFLTPSPAFNSSDTTFATETHTIPVVRNDGAKSLNDDATGTSPVERPNERARSMYGGRNLQPLSEQRCRATQFVSVATLTDINDTTVVSRDVYDSLQAAKEEVEVECAELRGIVNELREQLEDEKLYTSRKRKVVQYLRETLHKECSMLRSQLSHAQLREVHYQTQLREARDAQAHMNMMNIDANRSIGISMDMSTRFPFLNVTSRRKPSDHSAMAVSISPVLPSSASNVSRRRAMSVLGEEREEALGTPPAGAVRPMVSVDITSIHSLLDLVLLAVENDEVLPPNTSKVRNANMHILSNAMKSDPFTAQRAMTRDFLLRQQQMKQSFVANRVHAADTIAWKDRQIAVLKSSSNAMFLKKIWFEQSAELRTELRRVSAFVKDQLMEMKLVIMNTQSVLITRCFVVDSAMRETNSLSASQTTLREIISSAHALLMPMMTLEYTRGYHPWPVKLRNAMDPLERMFQARHGQSQLEGVRAELNMISRIYTELHNFIMSNHTVPQLKRPATGPVLRSLCASLVLNASTQTDTYLQVRERYQNDLSLARDIARINTAIMSYIYRQRLVSERSVMALREAGMDPMLTSMPAQKTVNKIAEDVRRLTMERSLLRKERMDNAREVYRLWKSKQIDIYEGYPPPTMAQRLVFIEEGKSRHSGSSAAVFMHSISPRNSITSFANNSSPPGKRPSFWDRMLSVAEENIDVRLVAASITSAGAPSTVQEPSVTILKGSLSSEVTAMPNDGSEGLNSEAGVFVVPETV